MKLTIKSLKQAVYPIELSNDKATVLDLKKEIENQHKFEHTSLKLVFNGKILNDTLTLEEYGVKDDCVLIMMSAKAKAQNVGQSQAEVKTNDDVKKEESSKSEEVNQKNEPKKEIKSESNYLNQINVLKDMGFPEKESEAAIKAAGGNIEIAIEFLYNGIPDNLPDLSGGNQQQSESTSGNDFIKNISSVVKIMIQNDPSQLQNILMSLNQSNPEIIKKIQENEEEFKNLIKQPLTEEDIQRFQQFSQQIGGYGGEDGDSDMENSQTGGQAYQAGQQIMLSKEEFEAIGRLKEMGFSEMDAVQAYFACDKNEDMAANFLFDNKEIGGGFAGVGQTGQSTQTAHNNNDENNQENKNNTDNDQNKEN